MTNPLVSLIVPVYNVSKYFDACMKSLVNQSYSHIEIILIDDGSTDNSGRQCDKWVASDERIRVWHQKNKGPASARNKGITLAKGEYVFFVDSDDSLNINAVQKSVFLATKYGADIVCFNTSADINGVEISRSELVSGVFPTTVLSNGKECLKNIYEGHLANFSWQFMYKKILLCFPEAVFPENICILEDAVFLNRVLPQADKVVYCPAILYHYHLHEHSLTQSKSVDKAKQGYLAVREIEKISGDLGLRSTFCSHGIDLYLFIYNLAGNDTDYKTASLIKDIRSSILRLAKYPIIARISAKRKIQVLLIAIHMYDFVVHRRLRFC